MKKILYLSFFSSLFFLHTVSQEVSQWRGPARDGKYHATSLLKEWPAEGPRLLWSYTGLGAGMGSPVIAHEKVYVTGIPDTLSGAGRLHVLDLEGRLLWTKDYGSDFTELFAGARSTPAVAGELIYIESGNGVVYCLNATTGETVWSVDFFRDLRADSVQFGFSESLLIDGDRIYCTPGGPVSNMVALNRFTGATIWSSTGSGEKATYSSPVIFSHHGNRIIVNLTASSILGISAGNGDVLWRFHQFQDNNIHANTPIYDRGEVLISSASRKDSSGLVMLKLSPDGKSAEIKWRNREIINLMGGAILNDSNIYLSTYLQPKWYCVDRETGKIRYTSKDLGGGAVISADGLLYCYTERDGEMALVEANAEQMKVISRFRVPLGTAQHWAHPVISHGKLFIRHGDALMVYQISGV